MKKRSHTQRREHPLDYIRNRSKGNCDTFKAIYGEETFSQFTLHGYIKYHALGFKFWEVTQHGMDMALARNPEEFYRPSLIERIQGAVNGFLFDKAGLDISAAKRIELPNLDGGEKREKPTPKDALWWDSFEIAAIRMGSQAKRFTERREIRGTNAEHSTLILHYASFDIEVKSTIEKNSMIKKKTPREAIEEAKMRVKARIMQPW